MKNSAYIAEKLKDKIMERERLEQIIENTESEYTQGIDNAYMGLAILAKYSPYVLQAANRDIIYSVSVDEIINTITEEDAIQLAKHGWFIDSDCDSMAHFV